MKQFFQLMIVFVVLLLLENHSLAQTKPQKQQSTVDSEKPQVAVAPVSTIGEIPESLKVFISNRLLSKLSQYFTLISQEQFSKAQELVFQSLDADQCTEENCIRRIQEALQVENLLVLQMVREGELTQLGITVVRLDDRIMVEDVCEKCDNKQLLQRVETLVDKLIESHFKSAKVATVLSASPVPSNQPSEASSVDEETQMWDVVKSSNNAEDIQEFLKRFPNGKYAQTAKWKFETIEWDQIKNSENRNDFDMFFKKFPKGRYSSKVQKKQLELTQTLSGHSRVGRPWGISTGLAATTSSNDFTNISLFYNLSTMSQLFFRYSQFDLGYLDNTAATFISASFRRFFSELYGFYYGMGGGTAHYTFSKELEVPIGAYNKSGNVYSASGSGIFVNGELGWLWIYDRLHLSVGIQPGLYLSSNDSFDKSDFPGNTQNKGEMVSDWENSKKLPLFFLGFGLCF
ncbi:hypothetical protein WDW89_22900 [Deltaproteobacteria bacterium TL4]